MKICIQQPLYLPYLGFFDKIIRTDKYIFFDNVQFAKRDFQHRNRIRTPTGWQWLTVPVIVHLGDEIRDIRINNNVDWKEKHWNTIRHLYSKTKYFNEYKTIFEEIYRTNWNFLVDLDMEIIKKILDLLNVKRELIISSSLGELSCKSTDALVELCRKAKATEYLSGIFGKKYLEEEKFKKFGIKVKYQEYKHPIYKQNFKGFEPNMSIIDLLFNEGPKSAEIITQGDDSHTQIE